MRLGDFEVIDWDDEDDEDGNLAHCKAHGVDERVVDEVLSRQPVELSSVKLKTAELAIVGPDFGGTMWTLLFARSYKRGDWLRPVTGREAKDEEAVRWRKQAGAT